MTATNKQTILWNRELYETEAVEYHRSTKAQLCLRKELSRLLQAEKARYGGDISILDVGTGTGFGLSISHRTWDNRTTIVGCDISEEMLVTARSESPEYNLLLFDGIQFPLRDASFDLVLLSSVLHHLADPIPLLDECSRVLKPHGAIIVTQEPNPYVNRFVNRLRTILGKVPDEKSRKAEYHQFVTHGIQPESLENWFSSNSFTSHIEYTNAALVDEIAKKMGAWIRILSAPVLALRFKHTCLSYSMVARRPRD